MAKSLVIQEETHGRFFGQVVGPLYQRLKRTVSADEALALLIAQFDVEKVPLDKKIDWRIGS